MNKNSDIQLRTKTQTEQELRHSVKNSDVDRTIAKTFNRPLSFISLSHSDNQSEWNTKFHNSSKADIEGMC